jgi:Uma2 family endonuclease
MATITEPKLEWNVGDLFRRFGPMPIGRIRRDVPLGYATEEDVLAIHQREKRLCELVDGILVEKTVGSEESYLAAWIVTFLNNFVRPRRLGFVYTADGLMQLQPGLVRIPDASFVSRRRSPNGLFPRGAFCRVVPALAVEVLSPSNTKKEMAEKLLDYFGAGVEVVWYVDPIKKTVRVYTGPDESRLLRETQTLDGGTVLPGFALPLRELFADPDAEGPGVD